MGRAAYSQSVNARAYQYPREKKPSSASTRITIRRIQRMSTLLAPPFGVSVFSPTSEVVKQFLGDTMM